MRIPSASSFFSNDQNLEQTTTKAEYSEIQTEKSLEKK